MRKLFSRAILLGALLSTIFGGQGFALAQSQSGSRFFPQTQQTVSGRFLEYWNDNGGLLQQGYPISPELQEQSLIDGKTYTVQYFERAVFELHPESEKPYDVLLALLGVMAYRQKYPGGAPNQVPNTDPGSVLFSETGKRVGGSFLAYFNAHGGVMQQGLPISDEFRETSDLDGKTRTVQYFERAVFEWNPSNTPPYNVLLSQLGTFAYDARHAAQPTPEATPTPVATPTQQPLPETVIPQPENYGDQYGPYGDDRYLVWDEGQITNGNGPIFNTFDVRALDLQTNQVNNIADGPGDQGDASVSGSIAVWGSDTTHCEGCSIADSGVYAEDLASGHLYNVATGFVPLQVGISGRKVAWLQYDQGATMLKVKDLDSNNVTLIREVASSPELTDLQVSGNYVVWNEVDYNYNNPQNGVSHIEAYSLTNGQIFDAYSYVLSTDYIPPNYTLDGDRLVYMDVQGNIFVKDLPSNDAVLLSYKGAMYDMLVRGDILLFSTNIHDSDIVGINLNRQNTLVSLVSGGPNSTAQYEFTIAGGRLVYVNAAGDPNHPDPIRLKVQSLPAELK